MRGCHQALSNRIGGSNRDSSPIVSGSSGLRSAACSGNSSVWARIREGFEGQRWSRGLIGAYR